MANERPARGIRDDLERRADPSRFPGGYDPLADLHSKFSPCMVRIHLEVPELGPRVGAAFHVGDGWLVSAAHLLVGNEILGVEYELEALRTTPLHVERIIWSEGTDDLALVKTDFSLDSYLSEHPQVGPRAGWIENHIPIGNNLDFWLDNSLVMTRVIVMGYPTISRSDGVYLVADGGVVNAFIRTYDRPDRLYFVVSTMARGGFSGGPVISQYGFLLGVMTDSFYKMNQPEEIGHAGVISVQPLWQLLAQNEVFPATNAAFAREFVEPDSG